MGGLLVVLTSQGHECFVPTKEGPACLEDRIAALPKTSRDVLPANLHVGDGGATVTGQGRECCLRVPGRATVLGQLASQRSTCLGSGVRVDQWNLQLPEQCQDVNTRCREQQRAEE